VQGLHDSRRSAGQDIRDACAESVPTAGQFLGLHSSPAPLPFKYLFTTQSPAPKSSVRVTLGAAPRLSGGGGGGGVRAGGSAKRPHLAHDAHVAPQHCASHVEHEEARSLEQQRNMAPCEATAQEGRQSHRGARHSSPWHEMPPIWRTGVCLGQAAKPQAATLWARYLGGLRLGSGFLESGRKIGGRSWG
jgi:hypothetical protein